MLANIESLNKSEALILLRFIIHDVLKGGKRIYWDSENLMVSSQGHNQL